MEKRNHAIYIIAIVALVAIVAVVMFGVSKNQFSSVESAPAAAGEETNFAGQAVRGVSQCPAVLKDHEFRIGVSSAPPRKEGALNEFDATINGQDFVLYAPNTWKVLANRSKVVLKDTIYQDFAGGTSSMEFSFENGCSRGNYDFIVTDQVGRNIPHESDDELWAFTVNGQRHRDVSIGERVVFADGSKIILREVLRQEYAGGITGVTFEFIC